MMDDMAFWDNAVSCLPYQLMLRAIAMSFAGFGRNQDMDIAVSVLSATTFPTVIVLTSAFLDSIPLSTTTTFPSCAGAVSPTLWTWMTESPFVFLPLTLDSFRFT